MQNVVDTTTTVTMATIITTIATTEDQPLHTMTIMVRENFCFLLLIELDCLNKKNTFRDFSQQISLLPKIYTFIPADAEPNTAESGAAEGVSPSEQPALPKSEGQNAARVGGRGGGGQWRGGAARGYHHHRGGGGGYNRGRGGRGRVNKPATDANSLSSK